MMTLDLDGLNDEFIHLETPRQSLFYCAMCFRTNMNGGGECGRMKRCYNLFPLNVRFKSFVCIDVSK